MTKSSSATTTIAVFGIILAVVGIITALLCLRRRKSRRSRHQRDLERGRKNAISRPRPHNTPSRNLPHGPRPTVKNVKVRTPARAMVGVGRHSPRPILPRGAIVRAAGRPVPAMRGPPPRGPLPAVPGKLSLKTSFGHGHGHGPVSPMTRGDWGRARGRESAISPM